MLTVFLSVNLEAKVKGASGAIFCSSFENDAYKNVQADITELIKFS